MKRIITFIVVLVMILSFSGCTTTLNPYQTEFLGTFDTVVSITGYTANQEDFAETAKIVYDEFVYLNQLFDIYNDYDGVTNIKTINDNPGTAVVVDAPIIELLLEAKHWYNETNGAVNIALGPVLSIWHNYRTAGIEDLSSSVLPSMSELEQAAQYCDINKIVIDEQKNTVYIEPGMSIDVGSIAKGFATQYVTEELIAKGVDSLLISAGGNVRAIGSPADERTKWGVGIKDPDSTLAYSISEENILDAAYIDGLSVVTSGIYERFYTVDGVNYHHIIDEKTLMPASHYKSVTVITKNSTEADALSTALFIMSPEQALEFVNSTDGVEALWVMPNNQIMVSNEMSSYLRDLGGASNK